MMERSLESRRKKIELLRSQLDQDRSSFIPHWRELGDYILPRRPRFLTNDVNRGERRNQKIIDSTATLAARTLRSGMMSGVTSPARPWFRLTTPDPGMADFGPVKEWLHPVSQRMSTVFIRSNLYNVLPTTYGDLGVFGTAAQSVEEDFETGIRCSSFPVGSFMIAKDYRGQVNTFARDFTMTVRQLVHRFGMLNDAGRIEWKNFSDHVKDAWERGDYENRIQIAHMIQPNELHDQRKLGAKFKRFASVYYERGGTSSSSSYLNGPEENLFLSESGYDFFPILVPRWEVTGEDVYGTDCPGMTALGDTKQLQVGEKRSAQAIEKKVNPPMIAPTSMKNVKSSILPGDITYADERDNMRGFRPAHEVNLSIVELEQKQEQVRGRVRRAFYEDLFLMLSTSDRREITAREIDERHEEKLLALGPVLEQLNQDLLDPLIDNTFDIMVRQKQIPPPPPDIEGLELKVEYISIMAQAQKLVGLAGIERFLSFAGQVASVYPEARDKIDAEQTLDIYGDMTSIPPGIIRPDEQVALLRQQQQEAAAAQQQMQQVQQEASTMKNLSQAKVTDDSALARLLGQGGMA